MKLYCDLHLHSCLSPCGDDDMTPNNIVNMAKLAGYSCIALTDHNTCGNCRATELAARQAGIGFLPGIEVSTAEDIHCVCIFPNCDRAEAFAAELYQLLPPVKNRPSLYGHQYYVNWMDLRIGEEDRLLLNAANISIMQLPALVQQHGGICYPAHIDKDANGILAILGSIPEECVFDYIELSPRYQAGSRPEVEAAIQGKRVVISSDAHYLWDIPEATHEFIPGDDELSRMVLAAVGAV